MVSSLKLQCIWCVVWTSQIVLHNVSFRHHKVVQLVHKDILLGKIKIIKTTCCSGSSDLPNWRGGIGKPKEIHMTCLLLQMVITTHRWYKWLKRHVIYFIWSVFVHENWFGLSISQWVALAPDYRIETANRGISTKTAQQYNPQHRAGYMEVQSTSFRVH